MVRWYDPDRPVPVEVIDTALSNAIRARVQGSARTGTSSYPSPVSSPHRPGHQRVHPFLCSASGSFLASLMLVVFPQVRGCVDVVLVYDLSLDPWMGICWRLARATWGCAPEGGFRGLCGRIRRPDVAAGRETSPRGRVGRPSATSGRQTPAVGSSYPPWVGRPPLSGRRIPLGRQTRGCGSRYRLRSPGLRWEVVESSPLRPRIQPW